MLAFMKAALKNLWMITRITGTMINKLKLFLGLLLFFGIGRVQSLEGDEENNDTLLMRIILPTCELKSPVQDTILNIGKQIQNLTELVKMQKLESRQHLEDEMRKLLDEVTKVQLNSFENIYNLINKTRKTECSMDGSTSKPQNVKGKDCADLFKKGIRANGVYEIDPDGQGSFNVSCDMTTSAGGWTVFQRRLDGSVDFYRGWQDYKEGFGNLDGEFWLGLEKIRRLTTAVSLLELLIDMEDTSGNKRYAWYNSFGVADENHTYKLTVGAFVGTAGDSLTYQSGAAFATKDADTSKNCARTYKGAWWYPQRGGCHLSNLNGVYHHGAHQSFADGINWETWKGYNYSLKSTSMKIRRRPFGP